jgi:hypothetical protein
MLFYKFSIIVKIRKKKSCQKIVKKLSKSCENCQKKIMSKTCQKLVKKLSKVYNKLSKRFQKVVKVVKKMSKNVEKLSKVLCFEQELNSSETRCN